MSPCYQQDVPSCYIECNFTRGRWVNGTCMCHNVWQRWMEKNRKSCQLCNYRLARNYATHENVLCAHCREKRTRIRQIRTLLKMIQHSLNKLLRNHLSHVFPSLIVSLIMTMFNLKLCRGKMKQPLKRLPQDPFSLLRVHPQRTVAIMLFRRSPLKAQRMMIMSQVKLPEVSL